MFYRFFIIVFAVAAAVVGVIFASLPLVRPETEFIVPEFNRAVFDAGGGDFQTVSDDGDDSKNTVLLYLHGAGNARSCPGLECPVIAVIPAGSAFEFIEDDLEKTWYLVNIADAEDEITVAYMHQSLFYNTPPTPVPTAAPEPVTLHALTWTPLYACASEQCDVLETAEPGTTWEASSYPRGEWMPAAVREKTGYVRVAALIATAPERCTTVLPYDIKHITSLFEERGFGRARLVELLAYGEEQWEEALNKNLFAYQPGAVNTVEFLLGATVKVEHPESGGVARTFRYPNDAVAAFQIQIFPEAVPAQEYGVTGKEADTLNELTLTKIIMHELGHAIGIRGHLETVDAIMVSRGEVRLEEDTPVLHEDDIEFAKDFCG